MHRCRDICKTWPNTKRRAIYKDGYKLCRRTCQIAFKDYEGVRCPCCSYPLKTKCRQNPMTRYQTYLKNRWPSDTDLNTMTLPILEAKYPRIKNRF